MSEFLSLIPGYFYVNVSRARYSQPGAKVREMQGRRFQRPITPSIPAPRNLPRPPWPVRHAEFLIANPRLEILTSPTKQTIGAKSNRERIAFFPCDSSRHPSAIDFRSQISNRNNRIIRNSPKCRRNNTYAFSNRNKFAYYAIFTGSLSVACELQTRPANSQQNVREPRKSVRIQKENGSLPSSPSLAISR